MEQSWQVERYRLQAGVWGEVVFRSPAGAVVKITDFDATRAQEWTVMGAPRVPEGVTVHTWHYGSPDLVIIELLRLETPAGPIGGQFVQMIVRLGDVVVAWPLQGDEGRAFWGLLPGAEED